MFPPPLTQHSGIGGAAAGKKNRTWKNLKQILAAERALPWQLSDTTCEYDRQVVYSKLRHPRSLKTPKTLSIYRHLQTTHKIDTAVMFQQRVDFIS